MADAEEPQTCCDMLVEEQPKTADERMALVRDKRWDSAFQLRIRFLEGRATVQGKVRQVAERWLAHANIFFVFVTDGPADVRIGFKKGGSWSHVGKDARRIAADRPTMNFGWLTDASKDEEYSRVVLHEFGHALGCIHEHQHPVGGIQWNKPVVYQHYQKTNGWDRAQVDRQVFAAYDASLLVGTKRADPASIMMYPIPPGFANIEVGWNRELSPLDKSFIASVYA